MVYYCTTKKLYIWIKKKKKMIRATGIKRGCNYAWPIIIHVGVPTASIDYLRKSACVVFIHLSRISESSLFIIITHKFIDFSTPWKKFFPRFLSDTWYAADPFLRNRTAANHEIAGSASLATIASFSRVFLRDFWEVNFLNLLRHVKCYFEKKKPNKND